MVTLAMFGCGGARTSAKPPAPVSLAASAHATDADGFTTPAQLEAMMAAGPPGTWSASSKGEVASWRLTGPFPPDSATREHIPTDYWQALLEGVAKSLGLERSEDLHCAAREVGIYHLTRGEYASSSVNDVIRARCGVTSELAWNGSAFEVPDTEPDADAFMSTGESIEHLIREMAAVPGVTGIGLWAGRDRGRLLVMIATGVRQLHAVPAPLTPDQDGNIVIAGVLTRPATEVHAFITIGDYRARECTNLGRLPPEFELSCRPDPDDAFALIDVDVYTADHPLPRSVWKLRVFPRSKPIDDYHAVDYGLPAGTDFVTLLNHVRKRAGSPPVRLDVGQSRLASRLAPYYFAARFGKGPLANENLISDAMTAGWEVNAVVADGRFFSTMHRSHDLAEILSDLMQSPRLRERLTAPQASLLGLGRADEGDATGVIGTMYRVMDDAEMARSREQARELFDDARKRARLPVRKPLAALDDDVVSVARAVHDGLPFVDARKRLLAAASGLRNPRVVVAEWGKTPPDIGKDVMRPELALAWAFTFDRPRGHAWGRYILVAVFADP